MVCCFLNPLPLKGNFWTMYLCILCITIRKIAYVGRHFWLIFYNNFSIELIHKALLKITKIQHIFFLSKACKRKCYINGYNYNKMLAIYTRKIIKN